jgi:hypothetical protein
VAFLGFGLLIRHFNFDLPDAVIAALIPAYLLFGVDNILGEPTTVLKVRGIAVFVLDARGLP